MATSPPPRIVRDAVAANHHEHAALGRLTCQHDKHINVPRLKEQLLALRRGDDVILQNVLVIEKKPDRVEIVPLQKVEVPSDAVLLEAVWRAAVRLRSKPIDALDREGLRVGVYVAIAPDKVEAVLRDGVGVERGLGAAHVLCCDGRHEATGAFRDIGDAGGWRGR